MITPARILPAMLLLLSPGIALASGQLGTLTETQRYNSHAACRAALVAANAADRALVQPRHKAPDGADVEIRLDTNGIERIGRNRSRYNSELWTMRGAMNAENTAYVSGAEYTRYQRVCNGAVMSITTNAGYTSPSYSDAPPAN